MIERTIVGFFTYFSFIMLIVAIVAAIVCWLRQEPSKRFFAEELFRWTSLLPSGVNGIVCAYFHLFHAARSAANIGWQPSPFQFEVGMADLAIGIVGVLAFWGNFGFRLAATIAGIVLYGGDAIGHVQQIVESGNYAPGNAGPYFWTDVIVPPILAITLFLTRRHGRKQS